MATELLAEKTDLWESLQRLDRDLRSASKLLGQREARYLVDAYYAVQDFRIQAAGQVRASEESGEPNRVLSWVFDSMRRLEGDIQKALGEFADRYMVGQWLQSITGIGPVISAGLLAHLDVRGCKTAGHFFRFAGLDPSVKWEKKQKRPWNAKLKVLMWKAGESFIKFQNHKNDYYGKQYRQRKEGETARNEAGLNAEACKAILAAKNYRADTEARKHYEAGKLPPAHIHARARRWTEKMFLSHVHSAMYISYYDEAPLKPYSFEYCPSDHRHFIELPNWPFEGDGESLRVLLRDDQPVEKKAQDDRAQPNQVND